MSLTLAEIIQAIDALSSSEQAVLIEHLQVHQPTSLDAVIAEHQRRLAQGSFAQNESLYGAFADSEWRGVSFEELQTELRTINNAWEKELDDILLNTP